jgi:hypothetical protein
MSCTQTANATTNHITITLSSNDVVKQKYDNKTLQELYDNAIDTKNISLENDILYLIIEDIHKQLSQTSRPMNSTEPTSLIGLQNKYQLLQQQYNKQSLTVGSLRKEIETLRSNIRSHEMSPDAQMVESLKHKIAELEDEVRPYRVQMLKLKESRKKNQQLERLLRQIGL